MAISNNITNTNFGIKKKEIPDVSGFSNPFTDESFVLPTSSFNQQAKIQYDRMKSTRKRTSDLIELDPQTAESMLLNIAGAWEEGQLRKEFNDIREGTLKQEQNKAKQKARDKMLNPWTQQMKEAYSNDPSMQRHIQGNWGYGQIMSRFDGDIIKAKAWVLDQPVTERFLNNRTRDSKIYNDLVKQREDIDGRLKTITGIIDERTSKKQKIPPDMRSMQVHLQKQFRSLNDKIDPKINQVTDELKKIDLMKSMSVNVRKIKKKGDGTKGKSVYDTITEGTQSAISKVDSLIDSWVSFFDKGEEEEKPYVPLDDPFATEESRRGATEDTASMDAKVSRKPLFTETPNLKEKTVWDTDKDTIPFVRGESPQSLISGGQDSKVIPSVTQQPSVDLDKMKAMQQKRFAQKNQGVGQSTVQPTVPQNLATSPATGAGGQKKEIVDNLQDHGEVRPLIPKNTIPGYIADNTNRLYEWGKNKALGYFGGEDSEPIKQEIVEKVEAMPEKEKESFFAEFGDTYDDFMNAEWGKEIDSFFGINKNKYTDDYQMGPLEATFNILDGGTNMLKSLGINTKKGIGKILSRDRQLDKQQQEIVDEAYVKWGTGSSVSPPSSGRATKRIDIPEGDDKKSGKAVIGSIRHGLEQVKTRIPGMKNEYYYALGEIESNLGKNVAHRSSAVGLFALMPKWMLDTPYAQTMGYTKGTDEDLARFAKDLEDPATNARVAAEHTAINKQRLDKNIITGNWDKMSSSPYARKEWEDLLSATHFLGITRMNKILGTLGDTTGGVSMQTIMTSFKKSPSRITALKKQLGKTKSASGKKAIETQIGQLRHDGGAYQHVSKFRKSRTKKRD